MTDEQRRLLAAELYKKDEAENKALREMAEEHRRKTGSYEGFFQPQKQELPDRAVIAKSALKSAMQPEKATQDSAIGRLVKALKDSI